MQFHEKKMDLFDFRSFFFAWTFLNFLAHCVGKRRVLLICGMGWPQEVDQDPDNNRCRPCPFVEQAAKDWNENQDPLNFNLQVGYQFIPCDGSVVPNINGIEDMGCNDHKNRHGQLEVAEFLKPRIDEEIAQLLNVTMV